MKKSIEDKQYSFLLKNKLTRLYKSEYLYEVFKKVTQMKKSNIT